MNNYINSRSVLPTTDIFPESVITQLLWNGATQQDIIAAGYTLLPETTGTQGDGDVLVADRDQNGSIVVQWMKAVDYAAIINTRLVSSIVRHQRTMLLAESDWTQGKDIPDNISTMWTTYRQALRDITSQDGFPNNVTWPTKPN